MHLVVVRSVSLQINITRCRDRFSPRFRDVVLCNDGNYSEATAIHSQSLPGSFRYLWKIFCISKETIRNAIHQCLIDSLFWIGFDAVNQLDSRRVTRHAKDPTMRNCWNISDGLFNSRFRPVLGLSPLKSPLNPQHVLSACPLHP